MLRNFSSVKNVLKSNINIFQSVFKTFSSGSYFPLYESFLKHSDNLAVVDSFGSFKYKDILQSSFLISKQIECALQNLPEANKRISFLCPNNSSYVCVLLSCWLSGNTAVPLCGNHPESLIEYFIKNSESSLIVASEPYASSMEIVASKLKIKFLKVRTAAEIAQEPHSIQPSTNCSWDKESMKRKALIIYTSGSTGLPKGVVLTHDNLFAQVSSLVKAWEISSQDSILHTLPLHHMHGIMNALLCLLHAGGTVVFRPRFIASEVWNYIINPNQIYPAVNLFYGVPTMYVKLIEVLQDGLFDKTLIRQSCSNNLRLTTSGSAALPEPVFHEWKELTGHYLLERFGMSEVGMALSNPLKGPRLPGFVGHPLPGVKVKISTDPDLESSVLIEGNDSKLYISPGSEGKSGELLLKGPNVFEEYWNNPQSTAEAFTPCGWFKTGDTATYDGSFKILGRTSVDIIKSAGYKISALFVESNLLLHPNISDCAVFGIPDEKYGERITALIVTKDKKEITGLKTWCKSVLPAYSVPSIFKYVEIIPRNIMGKVNKKELKKTFSEY